MTETEAGRRGSASATMEDTAGAGGESAESVVAAQAMKAPAAAARRKAPAKAEATPRAKPKPKPKPKGAVRKAAPRAKPKVATVVAGTVAVAEGEGEAPVKSKPWTQATRLAFFGELALTANVRRSAAAAGVSEARAYHKKRKDPAFAQAWGLALAEGYSRIEMMLLERALAGADEASGGAAVSSLSDRVLMTLYTQHRQSVRDVRDAAAKQPDAEPAGAVRARLEGKLAEMRTRLAAAP